MNILVIDIGGTNIKLLATGQQKRIKIPSGPTLTPKRMVRSVRKAVGDWHYDVVSLGYPGPVRAGKPAMEPNNLGRGWIGFDYGAAFGCPVRIINDAAMQALGSYEGGRMLFLGLGTGLGAAMIIEGVIAPLELADLPYRNDRTYEDYAGKVGLERFGKKKWRRHVANITKVLTAAFEVDDVVIGGGNSKFLDKLPDGARRGHNGHAFVGGYRLWSDDNQSITKRVTDTP